MAGLILAGEAVFVLPFQITRLFRPVVLDLFGITATELGAAQGVYGLVAMLAYFPGGLLADSFSARRLLAMSLWCTALGGIYLATFPGYQGALAVWGFFGLTTILLFWAALIKAAREWGGEDTQGRAYGLLEGGRGLLAAALGALGAYSLSLTLPDGYGAATLAEREAALRLVIQGYTLATALAGVFVWFAIPETAPRKGALAAGQPLVFRHAVQALRLRAVWLQALIVVCAYVGYKGFDNYSLYAVQAWGLDEAKAAQLVADAYWLRPVAALAAGLIADRIRASRTLLLCFAVLLGADLLFAFATPAPGIGWLLVGNVLVTFTAICALRGVYFALLGEAKVPPAMTGAAIGIVSAIGFTPDVFVTYTAGLLIDASPGLIGHQRFFLFLAVFAALGAAACLALHRHLRPTTRS